MLSDEISELAQRLVIGRKDDGRGIYDAKAKHELIPACREPVRRWPRLPASAASM